MKTILMMSVLSMISFSTMASASCDFSIISQDLSSIGEEDSSLKPEITQILLQKGYNVIDSNDIRILKDEAPEEILKDTGRLIVNIDPLYIASHDGCSKFSDGRVECGVTIAVGKVNADGVLENQATLNMSQYRRSSLFTSQSKIEKTFKQQVLNQANALIPECK